MNSQLALFDAGRRRDIAKSWQTYLADTLCYPPTQIVHLPSPALLEVFRDSGRRQCFVVVVDGITEEQASLAALADLACQRGAEFVAIGSPKAYDLYQVGPYSLCASPTPKLPTWTPGFHRRELMAKTHVLLPYRDESQLRKAFSSCHDMIYTESAKDPAAAFDLLSLIIAAKVMDEQSESTHYEFSEIAGEAENDAVARLTWLLNKARRWLAGQDLDSTEISDVPPLRFSVATTVFQQFQDYSLTLTGDSPVGTDVLGVAYEQLVGATFRGELGSYFTPRNIADFMVRLLDARHGRILDPSCGSGGLLIAAQRYARGIDSRTTQPDLYGNDLNPRMVEAAKVNFLVHRLDPRHVLHGDGLDLSRMMKRWLDVDIDDSSDVAFWDSISGLFDFVLANPPFAGHEKTKRILNRFATARRSDGTVRSLNKTIPFLELIVASLKEGGRAGVVIPTSILNAEDETFVRFRELLLDHAEIVAIIGLPEKAFVHTDCGIHGALLFFERRMHPRKDYDVFVGWIDHLGYDRLGKPTQTSDFPHLVNRFHQDDWLKSERVSIQRLITYQRWDPTWLRAAHSFPSSNSGMFIPLSEIVEVRNGRWSRKEIRDDEQYTYFEVSDADIQTGKILKTHTISGFELAKKGRIRNRVRSGDILLPNHRDSLMAVGATNGRSVVLVDEKFDGILTTDRFMILRPKIDAIIVVAILNSRGVRRQLVVQSRGAASLDIRDHALSKVLIPKSLLGEQKIAQIQELAQTIAALQYQLADANDQASQMVESEFGVDTPIRPIAAR